MENKNDIYCLMDTDTGEVYRADGTWKIIPENPVLFLSEQDAETFAENVLYVSSHFDISPVLWGK